MLSKEEFAANARRGAAWLDEHVPGWANKIDQTTLNLNSSDSCVLGQLSRYQLTPSWTDVPHTDRFSTLAALGFSVATDVQQECFTTGRALAELYRYLTIHWLEEVRERTNQTEVTTP